MVVASPRYFAGVIPFGVLTQTANAFGRVQGALSWFIDTFASLADWKATIDRLTTFGEIMAARKIAQASERTLDFQRGDGRALTLADVDVTLPDGTVLLRNVCLTIERGSAVLIQGPSGSGKTTLFRVLAGIWPFGHGLITLPEGTRVLFLPQRPYLPIGTLREALSYPEKPGMDTDRAFTDALRICRLQHLTERLDKSGNWTMALSPGEQQRLAFARALLYRPEWLFLDEATSALDEATEAELYRLLGGAPARSHHRQHRS